MESDVESDIPVETEEEVREIEVKSDESDNSNDVETIASEVSIESDVENDIPVETEDEVSEMEVKSDEMDQGDQTLNTKKRKSSGCDENLGHCRKSKRLKARMEKFDGEVLMESDSLDSTEDIGEIESDDDDIVEIESGSKEATRSPMRSSAASNQKRRPSNANAESVGFKCNQCQMDFKEKSQHKKHLDDKYGHKCGQCASTFRTESKLEEHRRISHLVRCIICNKCPEISKPRMNMTDHKKLKHCHRRRRCGSRFNGRNKLESQRRRLSNANVETIGFKCNPCQMDFEEKSQHKKHLDDKHGHKCGQCASTFRTESKLEEHRRISHSLMCIICNKCPEVSKPRMNMSDIKKLKHYHRRRRCGSRFNGRNKLESHMGKHRF